MAVKARFCSLVGRPRRCGPMLVLAGERERQYWGLAGKRCADQNSVSVSSMLAEWKCLARYVQSFLNAR